MLSPDVLLPHRKSYPSGLALAEQMGIQRLKLKKATAEIMAPTGTTSVRTLIRWGSAMDLPQSCQPEFTINTPTAISKACDKLLTLQTLSGNGILVPPISTTVSGLHQLSFPILARSRHGSQGKDIVVYEEASQVTQGTRHDFYSQHIPNTREYRVHVIRGEIVRIQGKYLDFPEQSGSGYIKNHNHGYRFRAPDKELNNDRKEAAIESVNALGLDFGAVDLIIGTDRKVYVLEVNTAPAMSPMTMGVYVTALKKILAENAARSTRVYSSLRLYKPRTAPKSLNRGSTLSQKKKPLNRLTEPWPMDSRPEHFKRRGAPFGTESNISTGLTGSTRDSTVTAMTGTPSKNVPSAAIPALKTKAPIATKKTTKRVVNGQRTVHSGSSSYQSRTRRRRTYY